MSFNAGAITGAIGLNTAPLTSALGRSRNELDQFQTKTTGAFSGISGSAGGLALKVGVIGSALGAAGAIIGGLTFGGKLVAEAEQAQVAFGVMLGSTGDAKALLADLNRFAASTPFEMPGLTAATRKLVAFGSSKDQVIPELRAIGDIAAGTGQDIGELAEIYGKARVQGRLMAEDVNQLTGRGIPIIQQFARQFGVAESEVRDLVSSGKINFANLQQAIKDMTGEGGQFAGMMAARSQTLGGLMSTLRDNVGMLARDLTEDIFERLDVKGFISDLTGAIPIIKGVLGGIVDLAVDGLGGLARMFGISGGAATDSGNKIVGAMEMGARGIAFAADMVDAAIYGYDLLRLGVTKYYRFAAGGIAELARLAAQLPDWLGGGMASGVADVADMFAANLDQEILKLQSDINAKLIVPSHGEKVMAFFEGIKQKALEAGDAASGVVPELEITAGITAKNTKADDLLGGLRADLSAIGLDDVEKKFEEIRSKGILNPDELAEARKLLEAIDAKTKVNAALESITTPLDQYQEQLDQFREWLAGGLIDQDQFDQLNAKANKDAFGEDKFASLNLVNSAEELSLRQKQAAAAAGGAPSPARDPGRQQVDELKKSNAALDTLVGLFRQFTGGEQATLSLPGL